MRNYPVGAPLLLGVKDSLDGNEFDEASILVRFLDNAKQQTDDYTQEIAKYIKDSKVKQEAGLVCCPDCPEKQGKCDSEDCCSDTFDDEIDGGGGTDGDDYEDIEEVPFSDDADGELEYSASLEDDDEHELDERNLARLKEQVEKAYWKYMKDYMGDIPLLGIRESYERRDLQEESILYEFLENARLQSRNDYAGVEQDVENAAKYVAMDKALMEETDDGDFISDETTKYKNM
ncbi:MAG: hypothetical protein H9W81_07635 [Enterococcus sp.]|nr:hypothetical protein [Enterococcus sp.]